MGEKRPEVWFSEIKKILRDELVSTYYIETLKSTNKEGI